MEITVHEEDVVERDIPIGPQSTLTAEEKAKYAEVFRGDDEPVQEPPKAEQAPVAEPELTADDLPVEETPKADAGKRYKVKLPDGEVEVEEGELLNGYLRQADYTRKTQELARLKAEAEAMREAMAYYQQPVEPVSTPQYQRPTGEFEPQTPTEAALYTKLQALEGQVGNLAQARQQDIQKNVYNQLDGEIKAFKDAHRDMTDEQFAVVVNDLNRMKALPSKDAFETIYKARFTDPQRIEAEAIKKYTQTLREKKKAAVAPSAESGSAPKEPLDVRSMPDDERLARAADILR